MGIVKYLASMSTLCLFQPWGTIDKLRWRFYSDSGQSSNIEAVAKRKSHLSYIAMRAHASIMFGSKCMAASLPPDYDSFGILHCGLSKPVCHLMRVRIHADVPLVSSAAAEVLCRPGGTQQVSSPIVCHHRDGLRVHPGDIGGSL